MLRTPNASAAERSLKSSWVEYFIELGFLLWLTFFLLVTARKRAGDPTGRFQADRNGKRKLIDLPVLARSMISPHNQPMILLHRTNDGRDIDPRGAEAISVALKRRKG